MYGGSPPHVQQVARGASVDGLSPALIRSYLEESSWEDHDLVKHLVEGFPLVGDLPVVPSAPEARVRDRLESPHSLLCRAGCLRRSLIRQQSGHSPGPHQVEVDREIFSQTVGEIAKGRMSPLMEVEDDEVSYLPVTRRFGVHQSTSDGRVKTRCIDDFAASGVNGTTSVGRLSLIHI